MGNAQHKYLVLPEKLKMATMSECMAPLNAQRHEGCGQTVEEAIKQLTNICNCYHIPTPKPIPDTTDSYYCGIIQVPQVFSSSRCYNTVWFIEKNNMKVAFIYYSI